VICRKVEHDYNGRKLAKTGLIVKIASMLNNYVIEHVVWRFTQSITDNTEKYDEKGMIARWIEPAFVARNG
jgi:hypothetical protein